MQDLQHYLKQFEAISLDEVNKLNLSVRVDSKSVFNASLLPRFLEMLQPHYRMLEINGIRSFRYETYYLDTPDLQMFTDHHRGKGHRQKIRFRRYADSGLTYFEIKAKNNKGRNSKLRIPVDEISDRLPEKLKEEVRLRTSCDPESLQLSLSATLNRITLIHLEGKEKLTFDLNIHFKFNGNEKHMDGLVIAEVKQIRYNPESDFLKIQHQLGVRIAPVSKYCLGIASLNSHVKSNRFKAGLRKLEKILN